MCKFKCCKDFVKYFEIQFPFYLKKYTFVTKFAKNCEGMDSIIKLQKSSVTILPGCHASSDSCSSLMPYQTAIIRAKIIKNSVTVFDLSYNPCQPTKMLPFMKISCGMFGIPMKCPIKRAQKFCYNGTKVSTLTKTAEKFLPLLLAINEDFKAEITVTHDTGISCFQGEWNIKKNYFFF